MKSQVWWYTARAGGTVAWALSAVSVVWGLLLSSRVVGKRIPGQKLLDLHRFLGGLAVVFTAVHLAGLFFDSYVHFGFREMFIPFASKWQPNAVAWGVVALYLLVAVEVTSLLRRRVGERVWRATHYLGFAVFVFGTIHGLKAGTDTSNAVLWWPTAGVSAAIIGLCVARVSANGDPMRLNGGSPSIGSDESAFDPLAREPVTRIIEQAPVEQAPPAAFEPPPHTVPTVAPRPDSEPAYLRRSSAAPEISVLERTLVGLLSLDEAPPMVSPAVIEPTAIHDDNAEPDQSFAAVNMTDHSIWSAPVVESHSVPTEPLPIRAPQRYEVTTEPATSLTSWRPGMSHDEGLMGSRSEAGRVSTVERTSAATQPGVKPDVADVAGPPRRTGPPQPPTAVDPSTGEPDPMAYRKWLKEWLAYVESQV